ncbi:putative colanic acid biosynthesis acetyltransferase [Mycobacterium sp. KBS0706]|uniref:putative colanic acid biosynthesis acetyltransferase n=1 Tax=Mycobacterium sp. KBS0706 TaxID=2578109 RepID=UPI00110FD106|nr:putative colanic acid biosynthesis acetyltransferase [Mycobacterium sp. KBS0706]TSD85136.1 putative colanic acid biosynthesis acetyltransferase [Mycobacterium sp. KBS0706]
MKSLDASRLEPLLGGPTFALGDRLRRFAWSVCWGLLAAWTPRPFHRWRRLVLVAFGARIDPTARVYGQTAIWWPPHLTVGRHAVIAPRATCYNVAPITIGDFAMVSQGAHLCTGTHDVDDARFPLRARPIIVNPQAWVAAEAFVGPGVTVGEGAVLGARGVAFRDLDAWTIHAGNPARLIRARTRFPPPQECSGGGLARSRPGS